MAAARSLLVRISSKTARNAAGSCFHPRAICVLLDHPVARIQRTTLPASRGVATARGLGLIMGGHVEHALLVLGSAGDLGELPIVDGEVAEEVERRPLCRQRPCQFLLARLAEHAAQLSNTLG